MSNENTKGEKREKYVLDIQEPEPFSPIGAFKLTTTSDLAKLANEVFKAAFADFQGIIYEPASQYIKEPTFSLIFNHGDYSEVTDEDGDPVVVGVKSALDDYKGAQNDPLKRSRAWDNLVQKAGKYVPTDDLIDVVSNLLAPEVFNHGKPKWGNIVVEYAERTGYNFYNQNQMIQYTKVRGISLKRLVSLLYGYKDEETGDVFDYEVRVMGVVPGIMNNGAGNYNWVLQILRASSNEVNDLCAKFGLMSTNSPIIQA